MGWDGFTVMDAASTSSTCACRYVEAVQKESCGRCIPCRVGTRIILDTMNRIAAGRERRTTLSESRGLARYIKDGSKCQIGQTGLKPAPRRAHLLHGGLRGGRGEGVKATAGATASP